MTIATAIVYLGLSFLTLTEVTLSRERVLRRLGAATADLYLMKLESSGGILDLPVELVVMTYQWHPFWARLIS